MTSDEILLYYIFYFINIHLYYYIILYFILFYFIIGLFKKFVAFFSFDIQVCLFNIRNEH